MTTDRPFPFRRALVIANPIAGRGRGKERATEMAEGLRANGVETELYFTSHRGDAPIRLSKLDVTPGSGVGLVVAVGGDGTIGEVLSGLPQGVTLAVIPMGTANVLSVDLKLPRKVRPALDVIRGGQTTQLDVARVNGRLSFLVTGVGLDAMAVDEVERRRSGPITKLTYVTAVLRTLFKYRPPKLTVEVDGISLPDSYALVLVSNLIRYGDFLNLSAERKLDDGLYEVYLFSNGTRFGLLRVVLRGVFGHLPGGSCTMIRAKSVKITSPEPVPYQVDGDFGGQTPVEIELTGEQHTLLIPEHA